MEKLSLKDILPLDEYEKIRTNFRKSVIDLKRNRRVQIGDWVSVAFENRETVTFQIQEMVWAEKIREKEKIQEELDIYNDLIPNADELSATLFIEIREQGKIREILDSLKGMDNGRSLYLQIGNDKIYGIFEGGRSTEEKISSVHYVTFSLSKSQVETFLQGNEPAALIIDHPNYKSSGGIAPPIRAELSKDLK